MWIFDIQELPGVADVLSTLLWIAFWAILLATFRAEMKALVQTMLARIRGGASVKLWNVELGAVNALPSVLAKTGASPTWRKDEGDIRTDERRDYYDKTRRVMLVHKLFQSTEVGELYDILIYVVPTRKATLSGVLKVEYFFGGYGWRNRIFEAVDRSRGFPVLTAAYDPFLCTAEVFFTDGERVMLHRYIDFEMGNAVIAHDLDAKPSKRATPSEGSSGKARENVAME